MKMVKAINGIMISRILRICRRNLLLPSLWPALVLAQGTPEVSAEIDTAAIRIGEQVRYTFTVDTDSASHVIFPEGQTFSPLETVEALKTDTTRERDRMTLQKIYALTQFDSGTYRIPVQRVEIDGRGYLTDSFTIAVATVPVDTIAQKMYDIKPLIEVDRSSAGVWKIILLAVLVLVLAGALYFWWARRKPPMTEAEKEALLPPYDRALLELKRLEHSKYLIQDEYKKYYSELTGIVRSYLEEDVHVTALESTTSQLIDKLELLKDSGELKLEESTILQFKKVLDTADLVKFAKSRPPSSVAEHDRLAVEQMVIKTKQALPEPIEEELLRDEEFLKALDRRKQRKKILLAAACVIGLSILGTTFAIAYYGYAYVRDTVMGHPTKSLLEGEWVSSAYGFPPISIETPEVLLRKVGQADKATIRELHEFVYHSPASLFSIGTSSLMLTQQTEPDFEQAAEDVLKGFEVQGARNIITKQEEFTTTGGITGLKIYGSGTFPEPGSEEPAKGEYAILLFGGNGFQQRIYITWPEDDPYAAEIVGRILRSVQVKTDV